MKYIVLAFLAVFSGCGHEDPAPSLSLNGVWKWKSTCGGIVGCVYSSDTQPEFLIVEEGKLTMRRNGEVTVQSTYTIQSISSPTEDSRVYKILLDGELDYDITIEGNKLTMDYHSMIVSVYQRNIGFPPLY
jgi:hypothetical protein